MIRPLLFSVVCLFVLISSDPVRGQNQPISEVKNTPFFIQTKNDTLTINNTHFLPAWSYCPGIVATPKFLYKILGVKNGKIKKERGWKYLPFHEQGVLIETITNPWFQQHLCVRFKAEEFNDKMIIPFNGKLIIQGIKIDENFTFDDLDLFRAIPRTGISQQATGGHALLYFVDIFRGHNLYIEFDEEKKVREVAIDVGCLLPEDF